MQTEPIACNIQALSASIPEIQAAMADGSCGFVYVATGETYLAEAKASTRSLRHHHPAARICLVSDRCPEGEAFWDDLAILERPAFDFRDKIEMRRAPYARCLFLDTDTTVVGDLSELFAVLTRYDVCGVQYAEGQDYVMLGGVPHAFPEMNGGLIGFRKGPRTDEFFRLWAKFYAEFRELNEGGSFHYSNVGDQKSLRAALWHSSARHACLGAEFNFIPFKTELASLPVAVLHTRTKVGLGVLVKRLNGKLGRRVYVPRLDAVVSNNMPIGELCRLLAAAAKLLAFEFAKSWAPAQLRRVFGARLTRAKWLHGNRFSPLEGGAKDQAKWGRPKP